MKKILVLISCLVLVFSMAVLPVAAAADGYDFLSTASQFFVNGSIVGEGVVLITDNDALPNANLKWAISVMLSATETEGVYTVVFVHTGDGNTPAITLEEGQVLLGVHSSSSDPTQIGEYQNVNGKLAAIALEIDDTVTITGIDLETGTVADDASIIAGASASTDESEPADESTPADESVPADESAPANESAPADTSAPADVSDNSAAEAPAGGNNTWIYIACGVAAVIIVAVVVVMVKKK
ncbi:MAG: hypothetical protein J6W15_03355 [Clostridia bacterium]|nr:hypothetical protein [Clostridia bacterium]MBO7246338.1 hypothetical protein [Clostridia bacterium]MBO7738117.1 hypothetical protein [Clostridia bacterium]